MPSSTIAYATRSARKPHGGFVLLTVEILCLLWWVYRQRYIQLRDLRVWLACQEMVARRCHLRPDQVPRYSLAELHRLVGGVGGPHLRCSLRRLEAHGLLAWSSTHLTFITTADALRGIPDRTSFITMRATIPNLQRRVPVPRPTLRLLALGCRATVIATILGHLIRCLYAHARPLRCVSGGWCKASWIAKVFQVDHRRIKAARRHLATLGWLEIAAVPQHTLNRWGSYVYVSLTWDRPAHALGCRPSLPSTGETTLLPPPPQFSTTTLPPPSLNKEPLQEHQHQQLAPRPDPLVLAPHTASHATSPPLHGLLPPDETLPPPTLSHIVPADLQDTARLLTLFTQAQTQGLIGKSDSDRLTFCALAEHAKVVGSTNPCGLFAALVRRQHWHFVTDSDEDVAQARLKTYLYGPATRAAPPPAAAPPALSPDAAIVRYVRAQLARAGWQGEAFGLVSRADPTWTRERWECATAELAQAQAAWQRASALNRVSDLTDVGDTLDRVGVSTAEEDILA
jgi:hypothetical protein